MNLTRDEMDAAEKRHLRVVGWCLKQRRLGRHMSQIDLADLAHVSRGEVQHVEHGRHAMREGTKFRLTKALGTSVIELDAQVVRVTQEWKDHGPPEECADA